MAKFIKIPEQSYLSSGLTYARLSPKREYIRILKACCSKPTTTKEIFPGVVGPVTGELARLARDGFLQKLTTENHMHKHTIRPDYSYFTYTKVWYQTTPKGEELIAKAEAI